MLEDNKTEILNRILKKLLDNGELYLIDTIPFMLNDYYENRFIAEYLQIKIRHKKLVEFLDAYKDDYIETNINVNQTILKEQVNIMKKYIDVLEKRAEIEDIKLPKI